VSRYRIRSGQRRSSPPPPSVPSHQLPWLLERWRERLATFIGPEGDRQRMEQMVERLAAHVDAIAAEDAARAPGTPPLASEADNATGPLGAEAPAKSDSSVSDPLR
jgi:hypothetical protein